MFNKLDKKNEDGSKDGKITKEELMEAVKDEALAKDLCKVLKISGTAESSGQEVEVLKHCASVITNFFSYADFNEDGGIDFKEFVVGVLAAARAGVAVPANREPQRVAFLDQRGQTGGKLQDW